MEKQAKDSAHTKPFAVFCSQAVTEKSVCYEIFKSWSEQRVKRICSCELFQEIDG